MAHARPNCRPDKRQASSTLDRRRFLGVGAACAAPLLAGTTLGRLTGAWAGAAPAQKADPILDHISRELMKVYRGMRGVQGVQGEHVRALAANLELLGARLQETGDDRRLGAKLRDGVSRTGRDAFAQELSARHAEIAVDLAERHGIVNPVQLGLIEAGAALDLMQRDGIAPVLSKTVPGLLTLAAWIDRARVNKDGVVLLARQKPGDDFLGYDYPPVALTCGNLKFLAHFMGLAAGAMGISGLEVSGGMCAIAAEVFSMLYDCVCAEQEAI
jgi:hypothetical protein